MVRIVRGERLTAIGFLAPADRYAEIRETLPKLEKELPSKWRVLRLDLRIQNPVHVPTQAEIHLIAETAKDVADIAKDIATVGGLAYAMWCFLEKRFPWIKKPKGKTEKKVEAHGSPRPKKRRRSATQKRNANRKKLSDRDNDHGDHGNEYDTGAKV